MPVALSSHAPLDLVIVMLGTNDVYEGKPLRLIADGLERLVEIIRHHPYRLPEPHVPDILLIAPPPLSACPTDADITVDMIAASEALGARVAAVADACGAGFFDAAGIGRASPADGYHLEAATSRALGEALRVPVARLLGLG